MLSTKRAVVVSWYAASSPRGSTYDSNRCGRESEGIADDATDAELGTIRES